MTAKSLIERIEYQIPILETNDEHPSAQLLNDCKAAIITLQAENERLKGALEFYNYDITKLESLSGNNWTLTKLNDVHKVAEQALTNEVK